MNNKWLSFIVVLCTLVSSSIMIGFDSEENDIENSLTITDSYKQPEKEIEKPKKVENESIKIEKKIEENKESIKEENYTHNVDEYNDSKQESKYEVSSDEYASKDEDMYDEHKYDYSYKKQEDVPVFKVSTDVIRKEVTLKDKQKLFMIATKLSPKDFIKIKEYLYWEDEEEGTSRIINLIKNKLSNEDYEKVKSILGKYIYM